MALEFRAEMLGEYNERQAAQQRLLLFAVLAAIGIFLLLHASFRSWRLAALAFLTLPIALVGGLLAAFFGGKIISLGSLVGFLTVFGIVARNGIMLISHCQHLEQSEGEPFGPQLVLRGAKERLVPIMMTVLTTGFALTPLLVAGSIPGQEIEHPMAVVILGGLVTATLVNLFVVPSMYLRFAVGRPRTPPGELGIRSVGHQRDLRHLLGLSRGRSGCPIGLRGRSGRTAPPSRARSRMSGAGRDRPRPRFSASAWRSLVTLEVPRGGVCQAEIATALGRGDGRISSAN